MTNDKKLRLRGKLPDVSSLDGMADELHRAVGRRLVFIGELHVADRTEPDPDTEAHPTVTLRLTRVELPKDDDEAELWRKLASDAYKARTAEGTFDGMDNVEPTGEVVRKPTATSRRRRAT